MTPFDISASWDAYYATEEAKAELESVMQNYRAILAEYGAENMGQVARSIYKYTACGAAIGVLVADQYDDKHWVWDDQKLYDVNGSSAVYALMVSSIVEGVDQTTDSYEVRLDEWNEKDDRFITPQEAIAKLNEVVEAVENEADAIWQSTHGCEHCPENPEMPGYHIIDPECPHCHGEGTIL